MTGICQPVLIDTGVQNVNGHVTVIVEEQPVIRRTGVAAVSVNQFCDV